MPCYKLTIAYDGTLFCGWQVQSNSTSIQTLIQNALITVLRAPTDLTGSGRTDAGVHAHGQTAHFKTALPIDTAKTLASLNGILPETIRIRSLEPVQETFHARYSAKGKIYHYHLHLDPVRNPFKLPYAYHVFHSVDLALLRKAAQAFVGTHDFSAFVNASERKSAVRTLYRLDCIEEEGGIRLEFEGNGFLYKMVRNIVGTLLAVSSGKIALEELPEIFASCDRRRSGPSAPPHGLFLKEVIY
ncbi:MAG: tRNA pseudouridine(38-40) synthase TruA [Verrucomicrobia bacterium]|nr:tRNA pseudouridine(38-40) synthase TruA [Verrucomicrobiota bacterium]